jgi:NitT/TauT family transport system substrate-binding protein
VQTLSKAALAAVASVALAASAAAQTKIVLGYTAVTDFASAYVAKEEGFFQKRGLDVTLQLIAINSTIPAALQADSLQIGGPTMSVLLQAIEGGLDQVVVAGGGVTSKSSAKAVAVVQRAAAGIAKPADLVGKKVGVPGIGAFLHVLFREWLTQQGVDWRKVSFVEVSFPTMSDALKGGSVDAVVTADPIMRRIVAAGTGSVVSYFLEDVEEGKPTVVYSASRAWAQKNPAAVKAFQEAIVEGANFVKANDLKTHEDMAKYIHLPPEILKGVLISLPDPIVTEAQVSWWVGIMKKQEMLKIDPKVAALIAK